VRLTCACKEGLCILVNNVAARILEDVADTRTKALARSFHDERLDLDRVKPFDPPGREERMGRKPRSEPDVCDARRVRVHAQRYCCGQPHGAFVDRCFPRPHLYARVRLSVCGYRNGPGLLNQTARCSPSV